MKPKYWVYDFGVWAAPSRASRTEKGWLHAQFRDGTNTLVRPGYFTFAAKKPSGLPDALAEKIAKKVIT